ncbi:DUF397 domain-containing protein [Nocardia sp. KC 131]|uniref:DUF397 domain-containing protein n=1 Tax=Nocardia arseniciresistens TaxID=3392119 RepID=UPI00398EDD68
MRRVGRPGDGGGKRCAEVALLSNDRVGVRDSKDPSGPALLFTSTEWSAFTAAATRAEYSTWGSARAGVTTQMSGRFCPIGNHGQSSCWKPLPAYPGCGREGREPPDAPSITPGRTTECRTILGQRSG